MGMSFSRSLDYSSWSLDYSSWTSRWGSVILAGLPGGVGTSFEDRATPS